MNLIQAIQEVSKLAEFSLTDPENWNGGMNYEDAVAQRRGEDLALIILKDFIENYARVENGVLNSFYIIGNPTIHIYLPLEKTDAE